MNFHVSEVSLVLIFSERGAVTPWGLSQGPSPHTRDWYFIAEQPAPAPHLAHLEGCAALRIELVTVPRVSRSCAPHHLHTRRVAPHSPLTFPSQNHTLREAHSHTCRYSLSSPSPHSPLALSSLFPHSPLAVSSLFPHAPFALRSPPPHKSLTTPHDATGTLSYKNKSPPTAGLRRRPRKTEHDPSRASPPPLEDRVVGRARL